MRCAFHFPRTLYIVKIKVGPSSRIIQFYLADVHGDPPASPPSSMASVRDGVIQTRLQEVTV